MKLRIAAALFIATFAATSIAYSHCHNVDDDGNTSCEDYFQVMGLWEWDEDNSSNAVYWKVNTTYKSNMPSLSADNKAAASAWSRIEYRGENADIQLIYNGTTTLIAENADRQNVVSWKEIGDDDNDPLAICYFMRWDANTYRILEKDIGFNYYHNWKTHAGRAAGYYCIRNVAYHEFGHFVGLEDVDYDPDEDESRTNCEEYEEYTMFMWVEPNEHKKISIECEEKYAMLQKYEPPE